MTGDLWKPLNADFACSLLTFAIKENKYSIGLPNKKKG